jgi:hypothetical protein
MNNKRADSPVDLKIGDYYAFGHGDDDLLVCPGPCILRVSMRYAGNRPAKLRIDDVIGSFDVHMVGPVTVKDALAVALWVVDKRLQRNERTMAAACPELLVRLPRDKLHGVPVYEIEHGT